MRPDYPGHIFGAPVIVEVIGVRVIQEAVGCSPLQPRSGWEGKGAHEDLRGRAVARLQAQIQRLLVGGNALGQIMTITDIGFTHHFPNVDESGKIAPENLTEGIYLSEIFGEGVGGVCDLQRDNRRNKRHHRETPPFEVSELLPDIARVRAVRLP
jgi:hypothetical protein